jgi:hypothetical protein
MNNISSIHDLIDWNNTNSINEVRYLFRGLPDQDYELIPKISRKKLFNKNSQAVEVPLAKKRMAKLLEYLNIRLPAYGFDFHNLDKPQRLWKELFIAQHYGVPTPLLDFTRNPMAGLFFACSDKNEKDGILYAICIKAQNVSEKKVFNPDNQDYNIATYDLISYGSNGKTPYSLNRHKFIVPPQFDPRIRTQNSVFCCFPQKKLTVKLDNQIKEIYKNKNVAQGNMDYIKKWIIPTDVKERILDELNKIGINDATLFPDMKGFGDFVSWKLFNIK